MQFYLIEKFLFRAVEGAETKEKLETKKIDWNIITFGLQTE